MLRFKLNYFLLAAGLFISEVYIAMFVQNRFIRYFFGDVLVVILMYMSIRSILKTSIYKTTIAVLLLAYAIEIFQYFKGIEVLGIEDHLWARLILGTTFTWNDILAYTLGGLIILLIEKYNQHATY